MATAYTGLGMMVSFLVQLEQDQLFCVPGHLFLFPRSDDIAWGGSVWNDGADYSTD